MLSGNSGVVIYVGCPPLGYFVFWESSPRVCLGFVERVLRCFSQVIVNSLGKAQGWAFLLFSGGRIEAFHDIQHDLEKGYGPVCLGEI